MDDLSFRAEFRRALDPIAPPAPWLAVAVKEGLRNRRRERQGIGRLEPWTRPAWLLPAVAVLLAIAIVVTLLVGNGLLHPNRAVPVRPPVVPPPSQAPAVPAGCPAWSNPRVPEQWLWPVRLAAGGVAWAQGGLRTTDDGAHWRDVSPAALHAGNAGLYPPGFAEFYLDGNHAWQAGVYGTATACFDHIAVFYTADGGKTWGQSAPVVVNVPAAYDVGRLQVGFVNAQVGWLWVLMEAHSPDPGFGPYTQSFLLSTFDGGSNWRMVSQVSASMFQPHSSSNCGANLWQMTFASPSVGWVAAGTVSSNSAPAPCPDVSTLVTNDGGITWKAQSQRGLCNCWTGVPFFVDEQHGFWQSPTPGPNSSINLASTSDGGLTWRNLPSPPSADFLLAAAPNDATDLWVLTAPPGWSKGAPSGPPSTARWPLYHSADGGRTWSLVGGGVPVSRGWIILFADPQHGMVVQIGVVSVPTELDVTSDGGRSWKVIKPAQA